MKLALAISQHVTTTQMMTVRRLLQALWEFITTISTAMAFTTIGLGALVVFGLVLALPIAAIVLIHQYLF